MAASATKRKEIYTYTAPWLIYGMNWSVRADQRFRLAIGSFEVRRPLRAEAESGPSSRPHTRRPIFPPPSRALRADTNPHLHRRSTPTRCA